MTKEELLEALDKLDGFVPFDYPETVEAYNLLKQFIEDNVSPS